MSEGAVVTLAVAVLSAVTGLIVIFGKSLKTAIEQDIRALLPEAAASLVRSSVKLLKQDDRAEVLSWFKGEFLGVRRKGESGVGVAAMFLLVVLHRAVVTRIAPRTEEP